ncbi:MAG: hypothetical protein NT084_10605 [Bacteroidetes bacterium]|nr:hypothetical protein [Bacteroidota bacterium]
MINWSRKLFSLITIVIIAIPILLKAQGDTVTYYPNGKKQEQVIVLGKGKERHILFFESGDTSIVEERKKLSARKSKKLRNNYQYLQWRYYYENGNKKEVACSIGSGKVNVIRYYEIGKISEKGQIKNGYECGKWILYYESGQKLSEGEYKFFKRFKYYDNNMQYEKEYSGSMMNGKWESWYENGQKKGISVFRGGYKREWIAWAQDGKVIDEGKCKGKKCSTGIIIKTF